MRRKAFILQLDQAIEVYARVRPTGTLKANDTGRLLQCINTIARVSRTRKNKNHARGKSQDETASQLLPHLNEIVQDLYSGTVPVSPWGLIHLLTCFGTLEQPKAGIECWQNLQDESSKCHETALDSSVLGAVIELMVQEGAPLDLIQQTYERVSYHNSCNAQCAMVGALLKHEHNADALALFNQMVHAFPEKKPLLARAHDKFIGDCSDTEIALAFFNSGIANETPYKALNHPVMVSNLLTRIWTERPDFDTVQNVWETFIKALPPSAAPWSFLITVSTFMKIFMDQYPTPTKESIGQLRHTISIYRACRKELTPAFLSNVLSSVQRWGVKDITLTIINSFDQKKFKDDVVFFRIALRSLSNIDVDDNFILAQWNRLVEQSTPLDKHDLLALLKACFPEERETLFTDTFLNLYRDGQLSNKTISQFRDAVQTSTNMERKRHFVLDLLRQIQNSLL